jgi:acyl-CoA synthetase (AMP-forming)/AMP-acid ligase II
MNIIESIERQALAFPKRLALINHAGEHVDFGLLWQNVALAHWNLDRLGIRQGDCVAVSGVSPAAQLIAVLALARMGAVSTTAQAAWPAGVRADIFRRNNVVGWVTPGEWDGPAPGPVLIKTAALLAAAPSGTEAPPPVRDLDDKVWRIALSSGTTGDAKSITWTHAQAARLHRASLDAYPAGPGERMAVLAAINIGLGLGHALMQLAAGSALVLPRSFEPAQLLATIARDAPTRAVATPSMMLNLVLHLEKLGVEDRPPKSSLLSLILGGSHVSPALRRRIARHICPNLLITYGSTEMGTLARIDSQSMLERPASAGRLVPWIEAQAVGDEDDVPLPPGTVGRLRFRSRSMASGYLEVSENTSAFKGGWHYPGDRGMIDESGHLTLAGRSDDVLNLQGTKVDPVRVEDVVNTHPSVSECAAFALKGVNDSTALALVVVPASANALIDPATLSAWIVDNLGPHYATQLIVAVPSLPRNDAGKLHRAALPALFRAELQRTRGTP